MSVTAKYQDYVWKHGHASHMHRHFMPHVLAFSGPLTSRTRVLDVGCGNGYTASVFSDLGCEVVGIDLSDSGIEVARRQFPKVRFELLAADDQTLLFPMVWIYRRHLVLDPRLSTLDGPCCSCPACIRSKASVTLCMPGRACAQRVGGSSLPVPMKVITAGISKP